MAAGKTTTSVLSGLAVVGCVALMAAPRSLLPAQEPKVLVATQKSTPTADEPRAQVEPTQLEKVKAGIPHVRTVQPDPKEPLSDPEVVIPDNPPPHEGAMIMLPYRAHPPDLIRVEVVEALPGRPISGERLVRPDGTISLGFYGDIEVVGLTLPQIKEKIIIHMRRFVGDESLGLIGEILNDEADENVQGVNPNLAPAVQRDLELPPLPVENSSPFDVPQVVPEPKAVTKPKASLDTKEKRTRHLVQEKKELTEQQPSAKSPAQPEVTRVPARTTAEPVDVKSEFLRLPLQGKTALGPGSKSIIVTPRDSDRVFVDVASYNSQVYYVLGEFNKPGRLPWTANETVLDALTYAGGLDRSADPRTLRLVRPAHGGKPSKIYPIDLAEIQDHGDAKANLQVLPGDRLMVSSINAAGNRQVQLGLAPEQAPQGNGVPKQP